MPRRLLAAASIATRLLGAVAVLVVGAVHVDAYGGPYSAVPTIGVLFLLNAAAAAVIGVALLIPLGRIARRGMLVEGLVTVAGIALAVVSLAMLMIAERGELFGFHEPGYDPQAIAMSRGAEIAAAVLLSTSLVTRWLANPPRTRRTIHEATRETTAPTSDPVRGRARPGGVRLGG